MTNEDHIRSTTRTTIGLAAFIVAVTDNPMSGCQHCPAAKYCFAQLRRTNVSCGDVIVEWLKQKYE